MQSTCLERQLDHQDFNSEFSHLYQQITFLLIVAKAENNCCKLPLEATAEDNKEETTASLATAEEAKVGSAIGAKVDCVLTLKEKQRKPLEAFSQRSNMFSL